MQATGRRRFRHSIFAITAILSLMFVWFLLPDRSVSSEIRAALGQPVMSLAATTETPPFSIRLESLDVPPRTADTGVLTLRTDDVESTIQIAVGQQAAIDGTEYEVTAIRPWAGLLHRAPGMPMLNIAMRPPSAEWIDNIFVERGGSRIVTPEVAVLVGNGDAGIVASRARWGVVEGDRTHWFSSFVPGTGVELDDGSVVTLLVRQPSARILVEIAAGGTKFETWVDANRYQPDSQIRYEDPGAVAFRIEIDVDERGGATVSLVEGDLERWSRPAEMGSILVDEESGLSVRIDQYERDALALFAEESPWFEVVLLSPGHVLRIREGEAVRVGEITVTFEALANPQPARAEITIGEIDVLFTEDTVYEVDGWRFDGMRVLTPTEISLAAAYTNQRWGLRAGLTLLLLAAALVNLYATRRRA